jgi:tRNA(fMet)-specific endonuclease VapC
MRKYVLDTNILMAYVRQSTTYTNAENALNLTADDVQLIVSSVSIAEIMVLAQRNGWEMKKTEALTHFFEETMLIVDVSIGAPELLQAYVNLEIASQKLGYKMNKNDLWVAATAKVTNAILVTTNFVFNHFDGQELSVSKIEMS